MMIIPLVGGYLKMLSGMIRGIRINESLKKVLVLTLVLLLGGFCNELMYVLVFMVFSNGILGTVLIRVYVFMLLGIGL
jgi:hypothetical protein